MEDNHDQKAEEHEEEAIEQENAVCEECDAQITEENTCPKCGKHIGCTCKCDSTNQ